MRLNRVHLLRNLLAQMKRFTMKIQKKFFNLRDCYVHAENLHTPNCKVSFIKSQQIYVDNKNKMQEDSSIVVDWSVLSIKNMLCFSWTSRSTILWSEGFSDHDRIYIGFNALSQQQFISNEINIIDSLFVFSDACLSFYFFPKKKLLCIVANFIMGMTKVTD